LAARATDYGIDRGIGWRIDRDFGAGKSSVRLCGTTMTTPPKIRIGISSCLLGQEVRYDGGHRHNGYITQTLGEYFEFQPFCPEVAIGLGIPRPPIRLVRSDTGTRVRGIADPSLDVTEALLAYAGTVAPQLDDVSGYILKKGSPSCGMERVKVYHENGIPLDTEAGMYARRILELRPELPVEEEGRLMDPRLRENFVERVFVYARWQQVIAEGLTPQRLVDFHTRHKFSIMAHDEERYRELGHLVADAGTSDVSALGERYIRIVMAAMKTIATPRRHANVLMHLMGFIKDELDADDKQALLGLIDAYRMQRVPLIVPLTLLRYFLRKDPQAYVLDQYYLNPHPDELMLRNHI
jgi:uncharacterized protein YbgA (DUF1722 family)/uncharacterized protein YbbK (DUF523 family)